MADQNPVEIKLEESPAAPPREPGAETGKKLVGGLVVALTFIFVTGLVWFLGFSPSSPIGAGWFLFSFAAGLSMIVLPCTLPLAFVIVPLSMGKGIKKGLGIAFAFGLGVSITLSLYGVLAAVVGELAIGTLGAPLEAVKNWLYFIAGIFTYVFALGELGLIKVRMPTYSGAHPSLIQKQRDFLKAFFLGLFLGNIGVGCPHPATPLILTRIAASGSVFYGWLLFFVHALGRVIPLVLLAVLGILGINALSWIVVRREKIEKATGWAMIFVAGFILVLGLFSHDWWVYSGSHSLFESMTQEERFLGIISNRLGVESPHQHGLGELVGKTGLFGFPLRLGNWVLVFLWVMPLFWYWIKFKGSKSQFWLNFLLTAFLALVFLYTIPHWFLQHKALEPDAGISPIAVDIVPNADVKSGVKIPFEIQLREKIPGDLGKNLEYSHERLFHVVVIRESFNFFRHIHPEDQEVLSEGMFKKGAFSFEFAFPQDGRYIVASDFKYKGEEVIFTKIFDVGERKPSALEKDFSRAKMFDGYNVAVEINPDHLVFGQDAHIKYSISKDGKPVTDLESYLGAPMHFAAVSAELSSFGHTHGTLTENEDKEVDNHGHSLLMLPNALAHEGEEEDSRKNGGVSPSAFGPDVFLHYNFPHPGIYAIFGEFKHKGKVVLTKFTVEIAANQDHITGSFQMGHGN